MTTKPVLTHYIRIEGANLAQFIEDTQDLSTVRGAGLLLLDSVIFAKNTLVEKCGDGNVECISQGASIGLIAVATSEASGLCADLAEKLAAHPQFQHITYLIDAVPISDDFRADVEKLVAMNRTRQLHEPSLVLPDWNESSSVGPDENFDRMRPAPCTTNIPIGTTPGQSQPVKVSASTLARRDYGRKKRRNLYQTLSATTDDAFADDLQTISTGDYGLCKDKVAVLYADGNKFSNIVREHCKSPQLQAKFDLQIRCNRETLVQAMLQQTDGDARWWVQNHQNQSVRRLETLLWGGDELIWVVPAWLGWELATFFFDHTKDWSFTANTTQDMEVSVDLTHSMGLVFASHKAPIQRLVALARSLAQLAKDTIQNGLEVDGASHSFTGRNRNLLAYDVIESFDFTSENIEKNWSRLLDRSGLQPGMLLLPGAALGGFQEQLRALEKAGFPQRQLHQQAGRSLKGLGWSNTLEDPDIKSFTTSLEAIAALLDPFPNQATWLHLSRLWNYVARVPYKTV